MKNQGMGQWDHPCGANPGCLHTPAEQASGKLRNALAMSWTWDFWVYGQSRHSPLLLRHPEWGHMHTYVYVIHIQGIECASLKSEEPSIFLIFIGKLYILPMVEVPINL